MPVDEVHEIIKCPAHPVSSVEDFVLYPSKESFTYRCVKGAIHHELIIPKVMLLISILPNVIEHCVTFFLNCITLFINPVTLFYNCITIKKIFVNNVCNENKGGGDFFFTAKMKAFALLLFRFYTPFRV